MTIEKSVFKNNALNKGFMFEFKQNFRVVTFDHCIIAENFGNFLEMIPQETKNTSMHQKVRFSKTKFFNNTGINRGMIHVTQNARLEIEDC